MSSPIGIKGFGMKLIPLVRVFVKYHSVGSEGLKEQTDGKWVGYDKIPLNIAPKIKQLLKEMKKSLPQIECPVIFFQGRYDAVIKKKSMDAMFDAVKSKDKEKVWLENNDHPILDSPDHEFLAKKLKEWIQALI